MPILTGAMLSLSLSLFLLFLFILGSSVLPDLYDLRWKLRPIILSSQLLLFRKLLSFSSTTSSAAAAPICGPAFAR